MNKNALIFDLDGTLWDVLNSTYKSANEVTLIHNLDNVTIKTVSNAMGMSRKEAALLYFPNLIIDDSLKYLDEVQELNIKKLSKYGGNIYDNVINTINNLKDNYDLYIVSNTGHIEYIESFLITSGLKTCFKGYIAASKLNISKKDAIIKIIKDNNIKNSVYIGDTKMDLEAALGANVPFIHARYGFDKDLKTKYYIEDIKELESILKEIF